MLSRFDERFQPFLAFFSARHEWKGPFACVTVSDYHSVLNQEGNKGASPYFVPFSSRAAIPLSIGVLFSSSLGIRPEFAPGFFVCHGLSFSPAYRFH